jgi:hypothetical protein
MEQPAAACDRMSDRACGDCTLCCKVMAIETLDKPAGDWCFHCEPGKRCRIYDDRPSECRAFNCLWLLDPRLGTHCRPSISGLVLTTSDDGIEIRCDPDRPDAWRRNPYRDEIEKLAMSGEQHDVTVLVITGADMTLVTPGREFHLGVVGGDERIVRELEGTRVVGATVVKASKIGD